MADEFEELRRANPVSAEEAGELVATDRNSLIGALKADDEHRRRQPGFASLLDVVRDRPVRSAVGGVLAVAVVLAVVAFALGNRMQDSDVRIETTSTVTSADPVAPASESSGESHSQADADSAGVDGPAPASDRSFDSSLDLVSIHFDYAHQDDGHATVAVREIASLFAFDPLVVAGTQTPDSDSFVHEYVALMAAAWDDRWLDATLDRSGALSSSLERWLSTLDAGGKVWVAEGGVSDFTAEVVREVLAQRPDLDAVAWIHVVQHSERNEAETRLGDLAFVQANTTYERIDDGNTLNGTAGLNQPSEAFETAGLAGEHGERWMAAFEYFAAAELDFSDTVTLLHIVGVGIDEVANPDDFAFFFMNDQIKGE